MEDKDVIRTLAEFMGILRAKDDKGIADAVQDGMSSTDGHGGAEYIWNGVKHYDVRLGRGYNYGGMSGNVGHGLWLWHNRHGQKWQADIEAHVAKWERRYGFPEYFTSYDAIAEVLQRMFDADIQSFYEFIDNWAEERHWFYTKPRDHAYALAKAISQSKGV